MFSNTLLITISPRHLLCWSRFNVMDIFVKISPVNLLIDIINAFIQTRQLYDTYEWFNDNKITN